MNHWRANFQEMQRQIPATQHINIVIYENAIDIQKLQKTFGKQKAKHALQ